jgi:hypothetical protein
MPKSRSFLRRLVTAALAMIVLTVTGPPAMARTAPLSPNTVGVVGGSITKLAVQGYRDLGGTTIWPPYQIGGGTIFAWRNDSSYFTLYEQMLTQFPNTSSVWWQLAAHDYDLQGLSTQQVYNTAVAVLTGIRQRTGAATVVYGSVMASYAQDTGCYLNGVVVTAPAILQSVLDRLVGNGLVVAGPLLPTLHRDELQDNGENCHQNALGQRHHGQVLLAYFD